MLKFAINRFKRKAMIIIIVINVTTNRNFIYWQLNCYEVLISIVSLTYWLSSQVVVNYNLLHFIATLVHTSSGCHVVSRGRMYPMYWETEESENQGWHFSVAQKRFFVGRKKSEKKSQHSESLISNKSCLNITRSQN